MPPLVKAKANTVRDRILIWAAWYLDSRGLRAEAMTYLKQAWTYRSSSAMATVVNWIESFARFSKRWGVEFDANSLSVSDEWQQLVEEIIENADKTGSN